MPTHYLSGKMSEESKERRTSVVEEYVSYLSDNLGMLHFSCRQINSIAQPKQTFEDFFFADVQKKIRNAFVAATMVNDGSVVQMKHENFNSNNSTKPMSAVLENETNMAANSVSTDNLETYLNEKKIEVVVDKGESNDKGKLINKKTSVTEECTENELEPEKEERRVNKSNFEPENNLSNPGIPEKYLCKLPKEAKTTLLELWMKSETDDQMDYCSNLDENHQNISHEADTEDKDVGNSARHGVGGNSDSKTAPPSLSPSLLNLSGYKAKRINIHLEPGKGCDLTSSKNLVKLTATVHLVGVEREERVPVNGCQSQEMVVENDKFHVLVPISDRRREVKVSFVLQVNPSVKDGLPSCFVEDIEETELDSVLTASIGKAIKGFANPINYVNSKASSSNQKESSKDRAKSATRKKRKVAVKISGHGRVSRKISSSFLVPVVHSTCHQRLIKSNTISKIDFFTRCITDNACQTLKRFMMKNLNSEKRTLQSTSNLVTSTESVTKFVKLVTQTAWIGPTKCSINGIVFKPIPLATYPRLHKLVTRISTLLARKAALPWYYNSMLINMCESGSDSYQWTAGSLDKTVFRPNRPMSILCVGCCRRLLVSDERGRVKGVVVMTNGSLLHLRRRFVRRFSLRVDQEVGVTESSLFLTFHRCREGSGSVERG
ncbi:hypothetical protein ACHWQZ_G019591 [Mnemiopsis leidyi]